MELASIILSIIALLGSLVTYIVHDRKIKRQEAKINEYQLAKIKEEEEDSKKAQICGNIIKYDKDRACFVAARESIKHPLYTLSPNTNIKVLTSPYENKVCIHKHFVHIG